jgi:hypothetical protein
MSLTYPPTGSQAQPYSETLAIGREKAAARFDVSPEIWDSWDATGTLGPVAVEIAGLRRWLLADLDEWAAAGMPCRCAWLERKKKSATPSLSNRKRVFLRGREEGPLVLGKEKQKLSKARYDVVKALLDAGEAGLTTTDAHLSAPKSRRRTELFSDCQGGRSTFWTSGRPQGCPETPPTAIFPRFSRIGGLGTVHKSS